MERSVLTFSNSAFWKPSISSSFACYKIPSLIQAVPEERLLLPLIGLALGIILKTVRNKQITKFFESRLSFWQIDTHQL